MKKPMIAAGDRFNSLTVVNPCVRMDKWSNRYALFRCDCGVEKEMLAHPVKHGRVKSCGCFKAESSFQAEKPSSKPARTRPISSSNTILRLKSNTQ